ncbi:MAG: efflux RND transporter permease subunit [Candidatus Sericytochromatia bacterium]|nr:efflux RND transporter permease subunit [Candidatus Tanganyikabacteria bacterium]
MSHGTRGGFNFSTFFIKNPVTTLIMVFMLLVLGGVSFAKMPLELFPNMEFPIVIVNTVYPGASPGEVETLVTKPLEEALAGVDGLDELHSTSGDGLSSIQVRLEIGRSAKEAANDIRDKISGVLYKLPKDTRPPAYLFFNSSSAPVAHYTVTGDMSAVALGTYIKEHIKPKLEQVEGVAQIQLLGAPERTFEVSLDPERLQAYGLSVPAVLSGIQQDNYDLPGGLIDSHPRRLSLRTMGKARTLEDLASIYLATPGGAQVQLEDLGTIRDTIKDRLTYAAVDGVPAVTFSILKQTDANAVKVVEALDKRLEDMAPGLPAKIRILKASDTTRFAKDSNLAVWEHLAIGALLAVGVLYLFLRNVASMLIAGLAIPLSIVSGFILMNLSGFTFNNVTMLALSLVVGILVDDAVVDLENIYRHMENGEPPIRAAINATGEIQLAVTATTLTIIGVFVPMSVMGGFTGIWFKSFGFTVAFTVLFSLLIARTLTPMLAAYLLKVKRREDQAIHLEGNLTGRYPRVLDWCLRHRWVVVLVATATFFGGVALSALVQKTFMSSADRGEFLLRVALPKGTPIARTIEVGDTVAAKVRQYPGVKTVLTMIGTTANTDEARLYVLLVDRGKRKESEDQIARKIRADFASAPGYKVMADQLGFGGGKPVDLQLKGDDLDELKRHSRQIASLMAGYPVFADVETSLDDQKTELRIVPDKERMAQLGLTTGQLAATLRLATTGDTPSTITVGREEVDVWVRLDPRFRTDATHLGSLPIQTARGAVPLSAVARLDLVGGPPAIEHKARQRLVHVSANLMPGYTVGTASDLLRKEILPKVALPPSIELDMEGQARQQRDAFGGFAQAMVMGVLAIYFILALQFGSFLHPLTIMFSLPLSISGAFLGLLVGQKDLGMMALIGIIMLMGIVTKNAILIVDFILTMRDRGYDRHEAVLRGSQVRLRPILMTTAAMVLGMLPMAAGIGAGSEFRSPMAVVVIGGLITSTLLTLVVVPVVYTLLDDFKGFFTRHLRLGSPRGEQPGVIVADHGGSVPVPTGALAE